MAFSKSSRRCDSNLVEKLNLPVNQFKFMLKVIEDVSQNNYRATNVENQLKRFKR